MATSRMSQAIHQVCGKIVRDGVELDDGQLLERFVVDREAAALDALVGRHGSMVWGVCRRILRNHHDAEDAFQAAFLVLVRKASSIEPRYLVGNWLYGVARQTALKAPATSAKRYAREKPLTALVEPALTPPDSSGDPHRLLDDELTKLPDKYRAVLILCLLQDKPLKEAARRLGLPAGTVASRLARGRTLLAKRLAFHGLTVAGVSLAAVALSQAASAGAPASVVSSTIKAGHLAAAGQTMAEGLISANVTALTDGVLQAMFLTKLKKTTVAALVLLGVLGAGVLGLAGQGAKVQQPANPLAVGEPAGHAKQPTKKDKAEEKKPEDPNGPKEKDEPGIRHQVFSVSGRAVDPDGKPVAGATVYLVSTNNSPARLLGTVTTDKDGQYAFRDAKLPYRGKENDDEQESGAFQVFGKSPGHAFAWSGMRFLKTDPRDAGRQDPLSYTPADKIEIDLPFAPRKKVEGRIVNEKGDPIAGVKLRIGSCDYVNTAGKEDRQNFREFWAISQAQAVMPEAVLAVTDDKGRFEFPSVPPDVFCWLLLEHPQYAGMTLYTATAENPPETRDEGHPVLKLPLSLTLQSVRTITVQVRAKQDDKPLAGIRITGYQQRASGSSSNGTSDKEGKVTLKLPPGKYRLVGDPPRESDYVRTHEDLTVEKAPAEQAVVFRQQMGCVLILKAIEEETGKSVPKVKFWYEFEKDGRQGRTSVQSNTVWVDNPMTNDKGELRAVVPPGKRRYGVGLNPLPDDYESVNPDDFLKGRELDLPAGKTITETYQLRKKK